VTFPTQPRSPHLAALLVVAFLYSLAGPASAASDPEFEDYYIKAPVCDAGDGFARSIAMSGNTLVVGAPFEDSSSGSGLQDNSALDSGAVYVLERGDMGWSHQALLKEDWFLGPQRFGTAVGVWGNWIAVASPEDHPVSSTFAGSVRFYERVWSSWEPRGVKTHSDWDSGSTPSTIVMEDDMVVVGSSIDGRAYSSHRSGSGWSAFSEIATPPGWHSTDRFGASLAISGDTLVIGAPREDGGLGFGAPPGNNSAVDAGAAYVYTRSGNSWLFEAYLKAPVPDAADYFGTSVAVRGDVVVVGAPREDGAWTGLTADQNDDSANNAGAAYVFRKIAGVWTGPEYIKAPFPQQEDWFGASVALGDGFLAVSSPNEDSDGASGEVGPPNDNLSGSGAVHVFDPVGLGWSFRVRLKAANAGFGDNLGGTLTTYEDTLIVGALNEASLDPLDPNDDSGQGAGAVYAYQLGPPPAPVLPFCFGDGTDGVPCPCGNASAFESDEGCLNSLGHGAILSATGSTSVLADDLQLHIAQGIASQPGVVLQGAMPIAVPFKDGKLCMGFPTERLEVIWFDIGGEASSAQSIVQQGNVSGPGVTTYYQAWYRDPGGVSPCGTNSNLSSGLRVDWM
jgi:FG-GAP repeat protein